MIAFNALAAEPPPLAELLKALNLSGYPSVMQSPEFSGLTADGQKGSLVGLGGRVVLLNFWATWCLECRPEMPAFERLHREFSAQALALGRPVALAVGPREWANTSARAIIQALLAEPTALNATR